MNLNSNQLGKLSIGWGIVILLLFSAGMFGFVPTLGWHVADLVTVVICLVLGRHLLQSASDQQGG